MTWGHDSIAVSIPQQVIIPRNTDNKDAKIELYSLTIKLFKHQAAHQTQHQPVTTVAGVSGGIANFALSKYGDGSRAIQWLGRDLVYLLLVTKLLTVNIGLPVCCKVSSRQVF